MDPLGKVQVAVKNSVDVLYFAINVPFHIYLAEDGHLGEAGRVPLAAVVWRARLTRGVLDAWKSSAAKKDYLAMWKEFDESAEAVSMVQYVDEEGSACHPCRMIHGLGVCCYSGVNATTAACVKRLEANNIFLVAQRSVNDQVTRVHRSGAWGGGRLGLACS
jgi:AP-1 complex subunit beta-1